MSGDKRASEMTEDEARAELSALAEKLAAANTAYHTDDAPEISEAKHLTSRPEPKDSHYFASRSDSHPLTA